jgi:hypothetical protein
MDLNATTNGNLALMSTPLAVFQCPSDSGEPTHPAGGVDFPLHTYLGYPFLILPAFTPSHANSGAKSSYDFVVNATEDLVCNSWPRLPALRKAQYMFGQNSTCTMAQVTDGMSNTLLLAETCFGGPPDLGGCPGWGYRGLFMTGLDPGIGINRWHLGAYYTPIFGTLDWGHAGSMRPGGCHFAFGDASVRFVSQSTSPGVLFSLSTINGGEVVSID